MFQIIDHTIYLIHHSFFVLVFDPHLVSISFSYGTIFICPAVPDMTVKVYGEVRRARESQTMVLPPFFSYTETDAARRWRLPWPFFDWERSAVRDRLSVWPFWEQIRGYAYGTRAEEERTWRVGWKLVENTELTTDRTREVRFNFFPFFTWERRWRKAGKPQGGEGAEALQASYLRIWPFWSSETVDGRTRSRTLELMPFRHGEGIERNWAPFWSLWEKDERPDGRTRHSLLWNVISWQSETEGVE